MTAPIVIIGAGQAGMKAAETLRQKGHDGDLVMAGDENWLPYQRPPLSKAYLKGEMAEDRLFLRPEAYFETNGIELKTGSTAVRLEPGAKTVRFSDGSSIAYSQLLLATGTRARQLSLPGTELSGVVTLRSMDDIGPIRERLETSEAVAIIGGGYVGMEFAAVAAGLGKKVSVIESQPRILMRSVAPETSTWFQNLHASNGVELLLGEGVSGLKGANGCVTGVELTSGKLVEAGLVLVAVGAVPVTDLAKEAGLDCTGGIVVDARARTSVPGVFAAGDCTFFPSARYGRMIRLESVQNAIDQAKVAAASMLGIEETYDPVPWFWSDQYDAKLQIAGLSTGFERTEFTGSEDGRSFVLKYYAGDRLLAVDTVNSPRDHMMARRDLAQSTAGSPKSIPQKNEGVAA